MNLPILNRFLDERFLDHRRRATTLAANAATVVAAGLFFVHLFAQRLISWDLFAVLLVMAAVKVTAMIWYTRKD